VARKEFAVTLQCDEEQRVHGHHNAELADRNAHAVAIAPAPAEHPKAPQATGLLLKLSFQRHCHRVTRLADFFAIHDRPGGVRDLSGFAGCSINRGCAHKKADLL
jgi:hypothetical protein